MNTRTYLNLGVAFVVLAAAITALVDWSRGQWDWKAYGGLLVIFILVMLWPFVGFLVSIPILLIVWFRNYQKVFTIFNQLKGGNS